MESDARTNEIINEWDLLKQINFYNINKLVTTTRNESTLCLVLELARGVDLLKLIRVY